MSEITFTGTEFKELVSAFKMVMAGSLIHPMLQYVLIDQTGILGTDLSNFLKYKKQLCCEKTLLLFSDLEKIAKSLKGKNLPNVVITFDDQKSVKARVNNLEYTVGSIFDGDFPDIPEVTTGSFNLSHSEFKRNSERILYATASDETKQVLTGVHINPCFNAIEFVGCDGCRMAKSTANVIPFITGEITLQQSFCKIVNKVFKGDISFQLDDDAIAAFSYPYRLVSRTIQGQYPRYKQLIPNTFDSTITVNRKNLLETLKNGFTDKNLKERTIKLDIENQRICSVCSTVVASFPFNCGGKDVKSILFNVDYLMDTIKHCDDTEITLNHNQFSPNIIVGSNYTHLLMPLRPGKKK